MIQLYTTLGLCNYVDDIQLYTTLGLCNYVDDIQLYTTLGLCNYVDEDQLYTTLGLCNYVDDTQLYTTLGLCNYVDDTQLYTTLGLCNYVDDTQLYTTLGLCNYVDDTQLYTTLGLCNYVDDTQLYTTLGLCNYVDDIQLYTTLGLCNYVDDIQLYTTLGLCNYVDEEEVQQIINNANINYGISFIDPNGELKYEELLEFTIPREYDPQFQFETDNEGSKLTKHAICLNKNKLVIQGGHSNLFYYSGEYFNIATNHYEITNKILELEIVDSQLTIIKKYIPVVNQESYTADDLKIKGHTIGIFDKYIYIYGGINENNQFNDRLWKITLNEDNNFIVDSNSNINVILVDSNLTGIPRAYHSMAIYDNIIFIHGGLTTYGGSNIDEYPGFGLTEEGTTGNLYKIVINKNNGDILEKINLTPTLDYSVDLKLTDPFGRPYNNYGNKMIATSENELYILYDDIRVENPDKKMFIYKVIINGIFDAQIVDPQYYGNFEVISAYIQNIEGRRFYDIFYIDNSIYLFGGINYSGEILHNFYKIELTTLQDVLTSKNIDNIIAISISSDMSSILTERRYQAGIAYQNDIYIYGGAFKKAYELLSSGNVRLTNEFSRFRGQYYDNFDYDSDQALLDAESIYEKLTASNELYVIKHTKITSGYLSILPKKNLELNTKFDNYYTQDQLYTKDQLYTQTELYTQNELYTKTEVNDLISGIGNSITFPSIVRNNVNNNVVLRFRKTLYSNPTNDMTEIIGKGRVICSVGTVNSETDEPHIYWTCRSEDHSKQGFEEGTFNSKIMEVTSLLWARGHGAEYFRNAGEGYTETGNTVIPYTNYSKLVSTSGNKILTVSSRNGTIYTSSSEICFRCEESMWIRRNIYFSSDKRIKENIKNIDQQVALNKLMQLKPITYNYIDKIANGTSISFGFIAQDVEKVLPEIVKIQESYIPNIMSYVKYKDSIITIENSNLDINKKLKIFNSKNEEYEVLITEVIDNNNFKIDKIIDTYNETIFVYGEKVNDFKIISEKHLQSICVASIKELNKKLVEQEELIKSLISRIELLEKQ